MGTFTDQVQGLASEKKLARLEREQRQKDKKRQEEQEKQLFYIFDELFAIVEPKERQEQYIRLSHYTTRTQIIEQITNNKNDIYILLKKYNKLLNNAFSAYKEQLKAIEKDEKEAEYLKKQEELNEIKRKKEAIKQAKINEKQREQLRLDICNILGNLIVWGFIIFLWIGFYIRHH